MNTFKQNTDVVVLHLRRTALTIVRGKRQERWDDDEAGRLPDNKDSNSVSCEAGETWKWFRTIYE